MKLTLRDIQALSDAELGKQLAEKVGWDISEWDTNLHWLSKYRATTDILCTSRDCVADIEEIVIAKPNSKYLKPLTAVITIDLFGAHHLAKVTELAVTATARQRAEACLLALQES